ncbi:hypothetical protein Pan97_48790 [Bremerella volcania]|uniref:Uncharacterized protein n=1 Tax=Bremerella volcania TaxID=2527984 RepID=A0A518CEZ2_9BACT|nr:hypothetical protein [Bremerella volcania]QDU77800.1 hypothetical protein Pan97_48790 [Bremerella volcania]
MNRLYVQQLAQRLGWIEPEFFNHRLEGWPTENYGAELVEWAECRISESFFLQVNGLPQNIEDYSLCVYAIRYQICSGWRSIRLTSDDQQRQEVARKAAPFFDFKHFSTSEARACYRREFPHSKGYSWKRIQVEGAPHFMQQIL